MSSGKINKKDFKNYYFLKICKGEIDFNSLEFISEEVKNSIKHFFLVSNKCKYCSEDLNDSIVLTQSYWNGYYRGEKSVFYSPCHEKCRKYGYEEEEYELQCIDADCNDCGYFKRDRNIDKDVAVGYCSKKQQIVKAYTQFCSAHPCFIHRKDLFLFEGSND
jgi:hypothetical protein